MSWVPSNHGNVRDKLAFDVDEPTRVGQIIASLFLEYQEVWVRRSSSGRGFHVVVDAPSSMLQRWLLRDCYGRWSGDRKRAKVGLPQNILFFFKNGRYASKWVKVRPISLEVIN